MHWITIIRILESYGIGSCPAMSVAVVEAVTRRFSAICLVSYGACHSVARWRLRLVYCMGLLGIYESRIRGKGTMNANL